MLDVTFFENVLIIILNVSCFRLQEPLVKGRQAEILGKKDICKIKFVFFWLVTLPEGRYRRQAPYADVSETLGLRGAPKTAQNGQK